jgi:hypothetical protein
MGMALIRRGAGALPVRLWGVAFLALAIGAVFGGSYHALIDTLGARALALIWQINVYAIGVFGFFAVTATFVAATTAWLRTFAVAVMAVILALYVAWMTTHDDFVYVNAFNGAVMAVVLIVQAYTVFARRDPASPWIIAGIVVSAFAALVQLTSFSLGALDHNSLFHLVELAGLYLLFRGASLLRSRPLGSSL